MTRCHENAKIFLAFCDVTRLKVLDHLRDGEKTATTLQELMGAGQSTLSHHMKILVESGVISARKLGKWTYYSICESGSDYASRLLRLLTSKTQAFFTDESNEAKEDGNILCTLISEKRSFDNMRQFTIIADTSCDLPPEYLKKHGIELMPIPLTLNDMEYNIEVGINEKRFYDALRNNGTAKTSLINPDTYFKSFTEYAKQGKDAIYIVLSSGLSSTYQSAMLAYEQVKESHPDSKIYPIDSVGATAINSMLVMLAVKKREEGLTAEETVAWLEEKKHSILGFFTVDDLMYLHRGGRLSMLSAIGGSLLSIKPVLNVQPDGTLALKDKARGRATALKLMVKQLKRSIAPGAKLDTVLIPHTDCENDALKLAELVKEAVDVREVVITMMSPVIGAHVGPGTVAVVFEADMIRAEYEKKFYK